MSDEDINKTLDELILKKQAAPDMNEDDQNSHGSSDNDNDNNNTSSNNSNHNGNSGSNNNNNTNPRAHNQGGLYANPRYTNSNSLKMKGSQQADRRQDRFFRPYEEYRDPAPRSDGKNVPNPSNLKEGEVEIKFLVSHFLAGLLIGKGGQKIKKFSSNTRTAIFISGPDEVYPGTSYRYIKVKGSLEDVTNVVSIFWEIVALEETENSLHPKNIWIPSTQMSHHFDRVFVEAKLVVPAASVGSIIGPNMSFIKSMVDATGASVHFAKRFDLSLPGYSERVVTIAGNVLSCVEVSSRILEKVYVYLGNHLFGIDLSGKIPTNQHLYSHEQNYQSSSYTHNGGGGGVRFSHEHVGYGERPRQTMATRQARDLFRDDYDDDYNHYHHNNNDDDDDDISGGGFMGRRRQLPPPPQQHHGGGGFSRMNNRDTRRGDHRDYDDYDNYHNNSNSHNSNNNNSRFSSSNNRAPVQQVPPPQQQQQQPTTPLAAEVVSANTTVSLAVPNQLIGNIIGNRGAVLRHIKSSTGAEVVIAAKNEIVPGSGTRLVTVSGEPAAVAEACELINQLLERPASNSSNNNNNDYDA